MIVVNEVEAGIDAADGGNPIVLTVEVPETKKVSVAVTPSETVNVEVVLNPVGMTNGVPKVLSVEGPETRMIRISVTVAAVLNTTVQLAPLGGEGNWELLMTPTLELEDRLRAVTEVELCELTDGAEGDAAVDETTEVEDAAEDDGAIEEGLEVVDEMLVEID